MQDRLQRRSTLRFAMVLVAASAPGLAVMRGLPAYLGVEERIGLNNRIEVNSAGGWGLSTPGIVFTPTGRPLIERPSYWLGHIPYWAGPCLVSWSVATLILGLRARVPVGHPGLAAGLAVLVAVVVDGLRCLQYATVDGLIYSRLWKYPESIVLLFWISLPRVAGYTVAVWWMALRLAGRGAPEPEPGTAAAAAPGRLLGWCWIAMAVASELAVWCFALNC